jgi:hypothetical protein
MLHKIAFARPRKGVTVLTSAAASRVLKVAATFLCLVLGLSFAPVAEAKLQAQQPNDRRPTRLVPPEEDQVPVPDSVAVPIRETQKAFALAKKEIKAHRYGKAVSALQLVRDEGIKAHVAAIAQIGLPPSDPEEDVPPGPVSVIAVLELDHKIGVGAVPLFRGMRNRKVVAALRSALWSIHTKRDQMVDEVVALDPEGDGADYVDDMTDMVVTFKSEVKSILTALDRYALSRAGRRGLKRALIRVRATQAKMKKAFGGGD